MRFAVRVRSPQVGLVGRDSRGGAFIEYLIILGVIAIAAITSFRSFGRTLAGMARGQGPTVAAVEGEGGDCLGGLCLNGSCFVAGTPVATDHGTKPIEQIALGERVLSRDATTGKTLLSHVTRRFVTRDAALVDVRVESPRAEGPIAGEGREGDAPDGGVLAPDERAEGDPGGGARAPPTDSIVATPGHLFWTGDRGWVEARWLEEGEALLGASGAPLRVAAVVPVRDHATVYNVEVSRTHTYFVGRSGVWVHNPSPEKPCDGNDNGGAATGGGSAGEGGGPGAGGAGGSAGGGAGGAGGAGGSGSAGGGAGGPSFVTGNGQVLTGTQAQQAAALRAAVRGQVDGFPKSDVVLAGVMDTTTGKMYYGVNHDSVPDPLNPVLAPYVEAMQRDPQHFSDPGTHAEIYAVNAALNAREAATGVKATPADLKTLMVDTAWLRGNTPGRMNRGDPAPFCGNCQGTIPGVINLAGNAPPKPPGANSP